MNQPKQRSSEVHEREALDVFMICPDCKENPPVLIEEFSLGQIVCGSCGRVLEDHVLDTRQEWRDFSNADGEQQDHSRVGQGANPLYFGSQLHTEILAASGGATSSKRDRSLAHALNKANNGSGVEKANQKLAVVYNTINTLAQSANFQKIVQDQACLLYKQIFQIAKVKVCPQLAVIASCLIFACRANNVDRTMEDICQLVGIDRRDLRKTFLKIRDEIKKVEASGGPQDPVTAGNSDSIGGYAASVKFVVGICTKLGITGKLLMQCEQAAEKEVQYTLAEGKRPQTRAAACILLVCRELGKPLEAKQLANHASVNISTVMKLYKSTIRPAAHMLIDPEWRAKGEELVISPA